MADSLRALLVTGEATGGTRRHVDDLAARLPAVGVEVRVVEPTAHLKRVVAEADVVHAHGLRAGVTSARARKTPGQPLVVTWHNAPLVTGTRLLAHRLASRYAARCADVTLGASPDLTAAARRAGSRDARDTFVVAPPLPAPRRSRTEVRAELGVDERPMVLAVGRLQRQKRLDVLVAAAAGWSNDPDGPVVVIAGSGPDDAALRTQVTASGACVVLLGPRDDVADLLAAADVVALPSMWEARSLVAQEALRTGVPLVATAVGGLPDLVGDAGWFVPVGDPKALKAALWGVLTDSALRERLATAGREQAATWPTVEQSVADLAATYRALLDKS